MPAPTQPKPQPTPERRQLRRRAADRTAARLHMAMSEGLSRHQTRHELDFLTAVANALPVFERMLASAAQVARKADPAALRVSRTPRGHLCVIRLHGPDWSLIVDHGRPLPTILVAVEDYTALHDGLPIVWRLDIGSDRARIAAMNLAILASVDLAVTSR